MPRGGILGIRKAVTTSAASGIWNLVFGILQYHIQMMTKDMHEMKKHNHEI